MRAAIAALVGVLLSLPLSVTIAFLATFFGAPVGLALWFGGFLGGVFALLVADAINERRPA